MFRPLPMVRLRAVVLARQAKAVLRCLGALGAVQLTRTAAGEDTAPANPPDRSSELARYDQLLSRITEIRRTLGIGTFPAATSSAMTEEEAQRKIVDWERRTGAWTRRRDRLQRQAQGWQAQCDQVGPYRTLDLRLQSLGNSSFLHFVTGTLPPGVIEQVDKAGTVVLPLPLNRGRQPILALTMGKDQTVLDEALRQAGFQREALPAIEDLTPEEVFAKSEHEQEKALQELEVLEKEGEELAAAASEPLAELQQWAAMERRLIEAEQLFPGTAASVLIAGWIPARDVPSVEEEVRRCTRGCCAVDVTGAEGVPERDVPVLLQHSRLLRPFEILVRAYGLPRYGELAPTLFVAISYVLMFGMMFGDVGHGLLVALAGGALVLSGGAGKRGDVGVLLLANGLSSALFGAAYGSYFGLPQLKGHALWRDPMEGDPMDLMLLAVGMGVMLMSVGLVLNILNRLRRKELLEGLFDKFGAIGVVFYWGALALVAKSATIQAQGWWTWAVLLFLAVPIACWTVKEPLVLWRHRRGKREAEPGEMAGAITESLVGAFEGVLLYLANTISFVRLAAYAMSHAALLMAAFTLAEQVRSLSPAGSALAVTVVIAGNVVAIVLEGIVAAVQALRLEYYEFFGKFFSGDGQPFEPFSLATERRG